MMKAVRNDDVSAFILNNVLKIQMAAPFAGFVIQDDRGMPVGAFALHGYNGANIELTICCDKPLGVRVTRYIARLAFIEMNVRRIMVHTSVHNEKAQRAIKSLGFVHEGRCKDFYADCDAYQFALLRSDQKLIRIKE